MPLIKWKIEIGMRFGRLVVVSDAGRYKRKRHRWNCLCDCGKTKCVIGDYLIYSKDQSCGCWLTEKRKAWNTTHGNSKSIEYRSWNAMKDRCLNPQNPHFEHYGGRGIKVCERWLEFANFFADMGRRPTPKHTLERINNSGNYEPSNCRWATTREQLRNRRITFKVEFRGESKPLSELCELFDRDLNIVATRIRKHGWTAERALAEPTKLGYEESLAHHSDLCRASKVRNALVA